MRFQLFRYFKNYKLSNKIFSFRLMRIREILLNADIINLGNKQESESGAIDLGSLTHDYTVKHIDILR